MIQFEIQINIENFTFYFFLNYFHTGEQNDFEVIDPISYKKVHFNVLNILTCMEIEDGIDAGEERERGVDAPKPAYFFQNYTSLII